MGRILDAATAGETRAARAAALARALDGLRRARIAVIHGGSAEAPGAVLRRTHNPRSWKSYEVVAHDIAGALKALGFSAVDVFPEDARLPARLAECRTALAWLNTGGVQGESPLAHAPSTLEMLGIPYVGLGPLNAALLDAKHMFKAMLRGTGLPTAPWALWSPGAFSDGAEAQHFAETALPGVDGPFVVKPVSGRASLHVEIAERRADLADQVCAVAARSGGNALVEPYLAGTEYCVSIMGPAVSRGGAIEIGPGPFAFSILERRLGPGERIAISMDRRPISTESYRLLSADDPARAELAALATQIHQRLGLEGIVRIDARRDADGRLMVLEANPKPDLKRPGGAQDSAVVTSFVAAGLPDEGMSYEDLILSILANRLADYLFKTPTAAPHLAELAR